ncbi:hypothetical protein AB8B23_03110 [Leptotrichia sp. HSP-342]|uniref:Uncharacterized protein n=1 Tax=Leptotrichia mesophila TaxID=3239303 RepID=A0AB39VCX4_9FUSO
MFPKIPKELLSQLKIAQEIYRQNALSIQLATNPSVNSYLDMKNYLHSSIYPIEQQLAQINLVAKSVIPDYIVWSEFINSAILAYRNTKEEEFEVTVNEIPVIIIKSKLEEYIEVFKSLKLSIPKDLVIKLAISYYIFALLLFVFTTIPELKPAGESFAAWIFRTGGLTFQKYFVKIVSLSNENNASDFLSENLFDATKLFLFYLFKKGYDKTFKKNSK